VNVRIVIAVVTAFVAGRVLTSSIAWACSCGPTGLDSEGRYLYAGGRVFVGDDVREDLSWPSLLIGPLAMDDEASGEFVLVDAETEEPVLTLEVDAP